jgi:hypothetical protein
MKKLLFGVIASLLLLTACRYEEGPFINFTNVEKRLRGSWTVSNVYKNGVETSTEFPTMIEAKDARYEFYKNKVLLIYYQQDNILKESSGSWEFGKKKKTIQAVFVDQYYTISREYEIVKFKNNELKLRFTDDNSITWTLVLGLDYSFVGYGM